MKKIFYIITTVLLLIILAGFILYANTKPGSYTEVGSELYKKTKSYVNNTYGSKHFWHGDLMSIEQVCKHWGTEPLDVEKFKKADSAKKPQDIRSKMACSLLKNQNLYVGKSISDIKNIFGPIHGHYFNDVIPAYIIGMIDKKDIISTWQIVFLIDRNRKIAEIVVHKQCCYEYE